MDMELRQIYWSLIADVTTSRPLGVGQPFVEAQEHRLAVADMAER